MTIDTAAQDAILLDHPPEVSKSFWCQGCGIDRPIEMRVMKKVSHHGHIYNHPRCTYCMGKVKENKKS